MKVWQIKAVKEALEALRRYDRLKVDFSSLSLGEEENRRREQSNRIALAHTLGNGKIDVFDKLRNAVHQGADIAFLFQIIGFCQTCGQPIERERIKCLTVPIKCAKCTSAKIKVE